MKRPPPSNLDQTLIEGSEFVSSAGDGKVAPPGSVPAQGSGPSSHSFSDAPPERLHLAAGTLIGGDFRILEPLAEGAHGALYVVEQQSTGANRALKTLHPSLVDSEELRERFIREAYVSASIDSEHVVSVVTAGVDESTGMPWMVTELLRGEDLGSFSKTRGALPADEAHFIMRQVVHALVAAHTANIVHRDLKPENVFLARSRRENADFTVKVLDFGIAEVLDAGGEAQGSAMGTPLWMAPEQWNAGQPASPATDVWAVGLLLYKLLTGHLYWQAAAANGTPHSLMREVLLDTHPAASDRARSQGFLDELPPGFDAFFARCLARQPEQRFVDALAVRDALEQVLGTPRENLMPAPGPVSAAAAPQSIGRLRRLEALAASVGDDPVERERTFSVALAMALADGELADAESELISQLADWFRIPPGRATQLLEEFQRE